jgi:hypothetical protein
MKKNKWLKWKIGAIASLGMALLFNEVKASTSFQTAYAELSTSNQTTTATVNQPDQIMNSQAQATDAIASTGNMNPQDNNSKTNSRSTGIVVPNSGSNSSSPTSAPQTRTHTRTGRS